MIGTARRWRRVSLVFVVVAAIAWTFAAWFVAQRLRQDSTARLLEHEQVVASSSAAAISANIGFALAHMRNIPRILAIQAEIKEPLVRMGPEVPRNTQPPGQFRRRLAADRGLAALAQRLEAMVGELGVDQLWVINAAGDCVASGGFPPQATATGVNYRDREYFWQAEQGRSGQQFAVGRTTLRPGIYHSAGVFDKNRFVGAVVVKIDVARLAQLARDRNVFITDDYGVVIIAGDPEMLMKAVPGARWSALSERELLSRYRRKDFSTLAIEALADDDFALQRLAGRRELMLSSSSLNAADALKIWVFRDVGEVERLRGAARWAFLLLLVGGCSVLACVAAGINALYRGREHQAEIARVNGELVALNDELRVQARFDAMTGCYNRRYFLEELEAELKRAARFGLPCSLALLDIDHFKQINDGYGHAAGDALLKFFVRTVAGGLRASDRLGRLGGEEFALLMPQTALAGALDLAERIRGAVAATSIRDADVDLACTVSIGVSELLSAGESAENLLARADEAMYQAKRAGRNRVTGANGHPAAAPPV